MLTAPDTFPAILRQHTEMTVLHSPLAPGLVVAFGRWRGDMPAISLLATGKGRDEQAAVMGCLGEMAENLSIGVGAHQNPVPVRISGAVQVGLDARALNLAQRDDLGSEGCACHSDPAEAALRAVFERLERSALAGWWLGQVQARATVLSPDIIAQHYRQSVTGRRMAAWRIDPVPGVCAVLALSEDDAGGRCVIGTAADVVPGVAMESAVCEALLAEIALIAPPDHPDHRRAMAFSQAFGSRREALRTAPQADPAAELLPRDLAAITTHCLDWGHALGLADLTHPGLGLPVFRCVCESLPSWRALAP